MTGAPVVLKTTTVAVTLPPPIRIVTYITARPEQVTVVAWPRVRVTLAPQPHRPEWIELPARGPQGMQRGSKRLSLWSPPG